MTSTIVGPGYGNWDVYDDTMFNDIETGLWNELTNVQCAIPDGYSATAKVCCDVGWLGIVDDSIRWGVLNGYAYHAALYARWLLQRYVEATLNYTGLYPSGVDHLRDVYYKYVDALNKAKVHAFSLFNI